MTWTKSSFVAGAERGVLLLKTTEVERQGDRIEKKKSEKKIAEK